MDLLYKRWLLVIALESRARNKDVQSLGVVLDILGETSTTIPLLLALDQFLQSFSLASITNELVFQQFLRTGPTLRILRQTLGDKVLEGAAILRTFESWGGVLRNEEKHFHRMCAGMRRFAIDHFNRSDTQ